MPDISVQVHGDGSYSADTTYNIVSQAGSTINKTPNHSVSLSFSFSRSSTSSSKIDVSVSGYLWKLFAADNYGRDYTTGNWGGSDYSWYGYELTVYFGIGSSKDDILGGWHRIAYKGATTHTRSDYTSDFSGDSANYQITWESSDNINVYLKIYGGCATAEPCKEGDYIGLVDSFSVPAYNPHTTPSVSLSGDKWSKYGTQRSVTVSYNVNNDSSSHNLYVSSSNLSTTYTGITSDGSKTVSFTPTASRDTEYTFSSNFYVIADASNFHSTASKTLGIWARPDYTLTQNRNIMPVNGNVNIQVTGLNFNKDTSSKFNFALNITEGSTTTNNALFTDRTTTNCSGSYIYAPSIASSWFTTIGRFYHINSGEYLNKSIYGYTYTQPSISNLGVDVSNFSPQDNSYFFVNLNGRRWNAESNFTTTLNISNSNNMTSYNAYNWFTFKTANLGTVSMTTAPTSSMTGYGYNFVSYSLTNSNSILNVQNVFNADARSVNYISSTIKMTVTSPNTNASVSNSVAIRVQYQPTQKPSNDTVKNPSGVDVQGKTVAIQDVPTITVGWAYNHNAGAAGVVNGYKVEIYDSDNVTKQIKYYSKSALETPVSITLDTATELKRGKMNYAKVTPYYFKPNQSGTVTDDTKIILGTQSYSFELVKPYYRMEKPVIEYPKNNTTWHNKDFRILTTIPEDPDFNEYTQQQKDNYTYGNIQVEITPTGGSKKIYDYTNMYSGYATQYPNCFSSLLTDYNIKKAIWLNKNDGDVATATKYTIRVRVQKANYEYTTAEMQDNSDDSVAWSPWSDPVVLNITAVIKQNLVKGNKIMATEQNTVANYSTRLLACYPFSAKDSRNVLKARGDIIYRAEYQGIYETIKSIITGVANYCPYTNSGSIDRRDVQFGYGTKELPSFTAIQEIILANETGVDDHGTTGRNYKNILTGYMIDKLK